MFVGALTDIPKIEEDENTKSVFSYLSPLFSRLHYRLINLFTNGDLSWKHQILKSSYV